MSWKLAGWVCAGCVLMGCGVSGGEEPALAPVSDASGETGGRATVMEDSAAPAATGGRPSAAGGGGNSGGTGDGGGVGAGGTAGVSTGGTGSGGAAGASNTVPSCEDREASTENGTLTTFPNISISVRPAGLTVTTLNFTVSDEDDPLLLMIAEVRNDSSDVECQLLAEVFLDSDEIVSDFRALPFRDESLPAVTQCLGPGDTGVLSGIQRGIDTDDLESAAVLDIGLFSFGFGDYTRATDGPELVESVSETADGWTLSGTVTPTSTIYNYGMRVYPRDGRGVLVGELRAFPGELETLPAGVPIDFETEPTQCEFEEFLRFDSWITGAAP